MHSKSNNKEFMSYDNAYEVVNELFELLLSRHQIGLETSMKHQFRNVKFLLWIKEIHSCLLFSASLLFETLISNIVTK